MDKEPLGTKTIRGYWREVVWRAFKPVWDEMTMRVLLILLLLLLFIAGISGVLVFFGLIPNHIFANRITEAWFRLDTFGFSVAVFSILFLIGIYRTPAEMYKEVGGFVENPFVTIARAPREKESNQDRWASVDIINASPLPVKNCFVTIKSVYDTEENQFLDLERELLWSWGHGEENRKEHIELFPYVPRIIDVA